MTVGWIGLGNMGLAMAQHVQRHLGSAAAAPLVFTNRTLAKGAGLVEMGAEGVKTVGEVVSSADLIFMSVRPLPVGIGKHRSTRAMSSWRIEAS